jgi:hypothetical protein
MIALIRSGQAAIAVLDVQASGDLRGPHDSLGRASARGLSGLEIAAARVLSELPPGVERANVRRTQPLS